jgi:hypothetical protein
VTVVGAVTVIGDAGPVVLLSLKRLLCELLEIGDE